MRQAAKSFSSVQLGSAEFILQYTKYTSHLQRCVDKVPYTLKTKMRALSDTYQYFSAGYLISKEAQGSLVLIYAHTALPTRFYNMEISILL